jgi:hypothetical protein
VEQAEKDFRRLFDVELGRYRRLTGSAKPLLQQKVSGKPGDFLGKLGPVGRSEEQPVLPIADKFGNACHAGGDHRLAEGHRFHENDRQPFHEARQDERVAASDGG